MIKVTEEQLKNFWQGKPMGFLKNKTDIGDEGDDDKEEE